jgi:hypothetical protein
LQKNIVPPAIGGPLPHTTTATAPTVHHYHHAAALLGCVALWK